MNSRLRARLRRRLRRIALAERDDFVIADGVDGYVHVEHALLRPEGVYVIDLLDGEGRLMAGERLSEWTLTGRRRFVFPNPLAALAGKVAAVRLITGAAPVTGVLVVGDGLMLPQFAPREMLPVGQLTARLPALPADAAVPPEIAEAWGRLAAAPDGSAGAR